jgi:MoxR-like ATPase
MPPTCGAEPAARGRAAAVKTTKITTERKREGDHMPQPDSPNDGELMSRFNELRDGLNEYVEGERDGVLWFLTACFLIQGHVLLEGNPGTAKTFMCQVLGRLTGLPVSRVQGTPDLMPGDIIGSPRLGGNRETLEWNDGPIFEGNLIVVDEINRMNPRTQSVTLQAMQEGEVRTFTSGSEAGSGDGSGRSRPLPRPHMFVATMNPIEQEGTYPLPEAQLDRFTAKLVLPPPPQGTLERVLERYTDRHQTRHLLQTIESLPQWPADRPTARGDVTAAIRLLDGLRAEVNAVEPGDMLAHVARLVRYTTPLPPGEKAQGRDDPRERIHYGGSPRGAQALLQLARVRALTQGRNYLQRSDIEWAVKPAMRHRVQLRYEDRLEGGWTEDKLLDDVTARVLGGELR